MRKYFYLFLLMVIAHTLSFAQIQKAYMTKNGKFTDKPKNAVSYILIQKLDGDSSYFLKQFDMNDTIIMSGFYKDGSLSIPNGRFTYYYKNRLPKTNIPSSIPAISKVDTNNFVQMVGYYLNGKPSGLWTSFIAKRNEGSEFTYDNGVLNGPYKTYHNNGLDYWTTGTMSNDLMSGKRYIYDADSLLISDISYENGKATDTLIHLKQAKPIDNFRGYLEALLKNYTKILTTHAPVAKFIVDKNGWLKNPELEFSISPEIDTAIIKALTSKPLYIPAKEDNKPVEEKIITTLFLFHDNLQPGEMIFYETLPPLSQVSTYNNGLLIVRR